MSEPEAKGTPARLVWLSSPVGLALAFALSLTVGLGASFATTRWSSQGEVLRGVFLAETPLSGLSLSEARARVTQASQAITSRQIDVVVQKQTLRTRLAELGVRIDVDGHLEAALGAGREGSWPHQIGWWLARLWSADRHALSPSVDEAALDRVANGWEEEHVEPRAFDGHLVVEGSRVEAEYPRDGFVVDRAALKRALLDVATGGATRLEVPLRAERATLPREAVDAALEQTRRILSAPIRLVAPEPPEADPDVLDAKRPRKKPRRGSEPDSEPTPAIVFRPKDLAPAVETHAEPPKLSVGLNLERVREHLDRHRERVETPSRNATFDVDRKGKITVVPSFVGRVVDDPRVLGALLSLSESPAREGPLPMVKAPAPDLSTEEAETLGVDSLVARFTTYHPCCQPRVKNIHRIADLVDGVVVRPGERFSVNEFIGPRTKKNGFFMAPTIVEGDMEKTVGGGISQFATTLFNAVLDGGYEIIQRQPHSYYFPRYPAGHEATLSYPSPDLIFRNDTKAGLVIKTEYGRKFIRVLIYGNDGGRKVKRKVGRRIDPVDPPIEFVPNEDIPPDAAKLVKRGVSGWSVIVSRVVTEPDGTESKQQRKVTYNPKPRVVEVHPCNIPEDEPGYTGEECPEPELPDGGSDESVPEGLVPLDGIGR